MMIFPTTLTDPNPVFKVTAFLECVGKGVLVGKSVMNSDWIKSLDENDTWEMRLIVIIAIFTFILLHLNVFSFLSARRSA